MKQSIDVRLVGMLGGLSAGKSFALSEIVGSVYEQGLQQKTEGFNIAEYIKGNQRFWYIDTVGQGEPLQLYKKIKYLEKKK